MSIAADLPVGRHIRIASIVAAYSLPAAVVWASVGGALNVLPLDNVALAAIVAYAVYYGVMEASGKRGLPPPGTGWQIPSKLVANQSRWRRLFIWGFLLGPGFATKNPYAGFGLLLIAATTPGNVSVGVVFAASIGALHGAGRGLALLRDTRAIDSADFLQSVLRSMYWRMADGFALLMIGGMAFVAVLYPSSL
jgi:hypothetical protein